MTYETIPRSKLSWARTALAVCAALCALAHPVYPPRPAAAQEVERGRSEDGELECISYCSNTRPGTVIMEVRMRLAGHLLNDTELRSKVAQQRLEATVYADGFERGLFAAVPVLRPNALFLARPRPELAGRRQKKIPGLERLVVREVATRLDRAADRFLLMRPRSGLPAETPGAAGGDWVVIRLEGLAPGMAYSFRVPGGRSAVTCLAAVCPVDLRSAPARQARRRP
ncbi:MAG: hypothetical protein LC795_18495 [Acidobacteria bacterium]|nr:hypothetical protein [Acidobacteriota bacterium]MCA1621252.1 hypothetical protein [Acidobacteriota bacterium]